MKKITVESALKLIKSTNGSIFSVSFTKVDGSVRDMVCRLGVKKGITGKGMAYDPTELDLLPVWDMSKHAYRMVKLDTLKAVKVDGRAYSVIQ